MKEEKAQELIPAQTVQELSAVDITPASLASAEFSEKYA